MVSAKRHISFCLACLNITQRIPLNFRALLHNKFYLVPLHCLVSFHSLKFIFTQHSNLLTLYSTHMKQVCVFPFATYAPNVSFFLPNTNSKHMLQAFGNSFVVYALTVFAEHLLSSYLRIGHALSHSICAAEPAYIC